jgi:hypothetical protein
MQFRPDRRESARHAHDQTTFAPPAPLICRPDAMYKAERKL